LEAPPSSLRPRHGRPAVVSSPHLVTTGMRPQTSTVRRLGRVAPVVLMATTSLVAADARPVPPTITGVAPWWLGVSLVVTGAALVYAWRQRGLLRERLRSAAVSESRLQHLFDYA